MVTSVSRNLILPYSPQGAPLCGFVTYIDADKPTLLRRTGMEIGNDIHDCFYDSVSRDNGRTWSTPQPSLGKTTAEGGYMVHTENVALYLPDRNQVLHITNDKLEPDLSGHSFNHSARIHISLGTADQISAGTSEYSFVSDFGLPQGLYVSFCTPIRDLRGRVLVPVQWQRVDAGGSVQEQGFPVREDIPDVLQDVWESGLLIGVFTADGSMNWRLGANPIPCEFEKSSRGMCEPTITELADGRLAAILRGSNAAWLEKPGYKWLSFSQDGGESWSEVEPLLCDDGRLIESSATGSALFRSLTDSRLYWIGNLCLEGERADGNYPRSPLVLCEMQEEPFALKLSTLKEIDRRAPHEDTRVQMSNFKFYQDRETGDIVLYLTRYGENGFDNNAWLRANLYEYRIGLG
jgi:hypothetical protein